MLDITDVSYSYLFRVNIFSKTVFDFDILNTLLISSSSNLSSSTFIFGSNNKLLILINKIKYLGILFRSIDA